MYMTPFKCSVSNPSKLQIAQPVPPVRCDGNEPYRGGPTTTVCKKAMQPMYWANKERNNMANPVNTQSAPTYSSAYGFPDGAQHQIFTNRPSYPNSVGDTLISNNLTSISSNPYTVLYSPTGQSHLAVQGDGNLVLYDANGNPHWSSNTAGVNGVAPYSLTVQNDGNAVLKDSRNQVFWSTKTAGKGCAPYLFKVRDVNRVLLVDCNSTPLWTN